MTSSDESLARAAADGDREALSALVLRHYDGLFALAFRLTGACADAEDLTHDICAALPAKLGGFRGEARFSTWLYRVAVNAFRDRLRRNAARGRAADGWGDWELARRAEAEERAEGLAWLMRAMGTLPPDLRETVALTMDADMTHAQAAHVLGVSEGTVSWRLSEVKKRLRSLREEELGR